MNEEIVVFDFNMLSRGQNSVPFGISPLSNAPPHAWSQKPRRHTFFMLLWIEAGTGWHFVDFEREAVQPQTLYFVAPNQIQYWDVDPYHPPTGWHLNFAYDFLLLSGIEQFFSKLTLFDSLLPISAIQFDKQQGMSISRRHEQISTEYAMRDDGWVESISAHLQLLLVQAQRQKAKLQPSQPQTVSMALTRQFLMLVKQDISADYSMSSYAQRLGVTASHLTEMVKKMTGLSAGLLIRQQLALEAKRWLVHSDQTAVQIAAQLGFKDASYFSRFFKRETGQSPSVFRDGFNKSLHLRNT